MGELHQNHQGTIGIPEAIIIASVIVSGGVYFGLHKSSVQIAENKGAASVARTQPSVEATDASKVKSIGEPFVGNPNAPVTMAYWFDYQCPFCRRFEEDTMTLIMNDYVKAGKVKVVFKDFEFLGPDSQMAGLAERAVWDAAPERFYEWHKAMYDNQGQENSGWATKDNILAITGKVPGIDVAEVGELMKANTDKYQKEIDTDKTEGVSFGINGTPGIIIGKDLISGAQPYEAYKQLIDFALQGK